MGKLRRGNLRALVPAVTVLACALAAPVSAETLPPPSSTLEVTTLQPFTPALPVVDGADIAALRTGEPVARPLESQLQLLFEDLFTKEMDGTVRGVAAQVSYSYFFSPSVDLRTTIPVLLQSFRTFTLPVDWSTGTACDLADSAYVCQLAAAIRAWKAEDDPGTRGGILTFDLTVEESDCPDAPRLFVKVHDLQLALEDIAPAL